MNPTIAQWLSESPLPKLEARMLLQAATGLDRVRLITHDAQTLTDVQTACLHEWSVRRLAGEPMAYILGGREFYGRFFRTTPDTLIPRPETEHLVDAALTALPPNAAVWDIGTGSGIIAITLACERPDLQVAASDISRAALTVAQENAERHHCRNITFLHGSWFDTTPKPPQRFHLIVSNPPYIPDGDPHLQQGDLRFEPQTALTDFADGLTPYRHLTAHAAEWLHPQGCLIVEHGYNQATAVHELFAAHGWRHIRTLQDLAGHDRITIGQYDERTTASAAQAPAI